MEERTKTIAAIAILIGIAVLILIVIGVVVTGKKVVSPIPDEGAIKIIFITPAPASIMPTATVSATPGLNNR
jgi:hypothetical protein